MARAITLIRSSSLTDVAEYAYAATAPAESRLIFLAGACPLNEDGSTAAIGDYTGQAAKAVENMWIAADRGWGIGRERHQPPSARRVNQPGRSGGRLGGVRDASGDHDAPSPLIGVTVLGYDDQLVEIEAVAAVLD